MNSFFRTSFTAAIGPVCAAILALWGLAGCSSQAQQTPNKTTPTTRPSAPLPASPLRSSPQVLVNAPVVAADAEAPPGGWHSDLAAAQAVAKNTNRPLVVVFSGSDWCRPCVVYEQEVFAQPAFAAYAANRLVLAHFDYPRLPQNQLSAAQTKRNAAAAAQLNREGDFPLAVIVSPQGRVLAKTGYLAGGPAAFRAYLEKILGQ